MNTSASFNFTELELRGGELPLPNSSQEKRSILKEPIDEPFVKGPIPIRWFKEAYVAGKAAHGLVPVLWYYHALNGQCFEINLSRLKLLWGISRQTAGRGLRELQDAALIEVERKSGSKSKIKMLKAELKRRASK